MFCLKWFRWSKERASEFNKGGREVKVGVKRWAEMILTCNSTSNSIGWTWTMNNVRILFLAFWWISKQCFIFKGLHITTNMLWCEWIRSKMIIFEGIGKKVGRQTRRATRYQIRPRAWGEMSEWRSRKDCTKPLLYIHASEKGRKW